MNAHIVTRSWTKNKRIGAKRFWTPDIRPTHGKVVLRERDFTMLRHLANHRLLDTKLMHKLMGGSYRALARRLRQLALNGYIDRPTAQINYYQRGGGSDPLVIALSTKGARALTKVGDTPFAKHLTRKNNSVRRPFIDHTLATARFMVDLDLGCRKSSKTHLLGPDAVLARAPYKTRTAKNITMGWHTRIDDGRTSEHVAIIPDKMFSLLDSDTDEVSHFCLEADRNSMPVNATSLKRSSIRRKVLAYREVFKTRAHERKFGWHNMRIIFETTTPTHAKAIKDCITEIYKGRATGMFLVAIEGELSGQNLLDHEFETAFGVRAQLFA